MAAAPAAPPPPAAAPAAPAPAPAAPQTPTPVIRVSQMPTTATPTPPVQPGSAREAMNERLRKLASKGETAVTAPAAPASPKLAPPETPLAPSPEGVSPPESPLPGEEEAATPEGAPPTAETKPGEKAKVSPWKLVEQYKGRTSTLEKEIADLKAKAIPETERKEFQSRLEKAEARVKEYEDEMRYVNFSKSDEFKQKYQEPYEKQWKRAMTELGELTIQPDGEERRAIRADDLAQLVSMPLGQAREVADQLFGKFSNDVMEHRKEIKRLFEEQSAALDDARKTGAERDKKRAEDYQRGQQAVSEAVSNIWKSANNASVADPKYGKYFTPSDGDEQGNQRLAKGYELVDRAFNENPSDPKLTPEQRASIVKRHAAVRHRAAAFGRMVYMNEQLQAKLTAVEQELAQYKTSTPEAGSGAKAPSTAGEMSAKDRMFENLRKRAR